MLILIIKSELELIYEALNMESKKPRREPSHSTKFVLIGVIVFLSILLVTFIAKFTTLKTLFWLE